MLVMFIFFCYRFVNRYDGEISCKKSSDQQSTSKRSHCNSPFFPGWEIMFVRFRHPLHGKEGMKQGWCHDQVAFEPASHNDHCSGHKCRKGLSSFSEQEHDQWKDHPD